MLKKICKNLKKFLKNENVLDIFIFGSFLQKKISYNDIDVAVLFIKEDKNNIDIIRKIQKESKDYRVSHISVNDFFKRMHPLVMTILKEGYSVSSEKKYSEFIGFQNRVLFIYNLKGQSASEKVKFSYVLHGRGADRGLLKKYKAKKMGKQVISVQPEYEKIFTKLFENFRVDYEKRYVLIY